MVLRRLAGLLVCGGLSALSVACSDPDNPGSQGSAAGQSNGGMGGSGTSGGGGSGGGTAGMPDPGLLPNGAGREYRGIVNLVNAEAAKALDDFMLDADPFLGGSGELDLALPLKLFYTHYGDDYDFVYFFTDHALDTSVGGLHSAVNRPPMPGTGKEQPYSSGIGPARLRSAIGIQLESSGSFPPLAHEFAHDFAVDLAAEFGFSKDVDSVFAGHWGMVSANGQLGGFDAATLRCETPAAAIPPNCTAGAGGRFRYKMAPFFPNTVWDRAKPFGPLELYLMGLLPAAEAPASLQRLDGANFPFETITLEEDGNIMLEGTGVSEILLSQIIERHGPVPLRAQNDRQFTAAMVLVSATPAAQQHLDRVADVAAIFGGEQKSSESPSFAELTGNRASMSCKLGPRHAPQTPPEEYDIPPYISCSPQKQDCAGGLACYGMFDLYCAKPGTADAEQPCDRDSDCKAGLLCGAVPPAFTERVCTPYCDQDNAAAANACATLCPGGFSPVYNADLTMTLGAFCHPGSGASCDPLAQECGDGKACTGSDVTSCEITGNLPAGAVCLFNGECAKGTTCIGVLGEESTHCQAYCDLSPTAPSGTDCISKCPNGAWDYPGGYGICIP